MLIGGIGDKQGKEVYEGDVVTCDKFLMGPMVILTTTELTASTSWDNYVTGLRPFSMLGPSIENVEVIGSIFGDPEAVKIRGVLIDAGM